MRISIETPAGIRPKMASQLLSGTEAQIAENCYFANGHIKPWLNYIDVQALTNEGAIKTVYRHRADKWFEWEADVDILGAPVSGDTDERMYYMGDGIPKKTNHVEAVTGSGALPINFYPLAVPTPVLEAVLSVGGGGSGDTRSINYLWTVVTTWGEEGLPSPASEVVETMPGQTINLSDMTLEWQAATACYNGVFVFPSGDEDGVYVYKCVSKGTTGASEPTWNETLDGDTVDGGVTWRCYKNNLLEKRLYRLNVGDQYASYQYVDKIAIATTVYSDSKLGSDLGEPIPSIDYDPPLDELRGLTYMGHGIFAAFTGKDLYFTEPYKPWAWPIVYSLSILSDIVALAAVGNTLTVLTEDVPYIVAGVDPSALVSTPLPESRPCLSKRSVVTYIHGVCYATSNGIAVINGQTSDLITKESFDVKTWKPYYPATMHGYIHDNKYFLFYSYDSTEGSLVVDLFTGVVSTLSLYTDSAFVDDETDILYFQKLVEAVNHVYEWEGDSTQPYPVNLKWRSKIFLLPTRSRFQVFRVLSELGDRGAYQTLINSHNIALQHNIDAIASGSIGGSVGESALGSGTPVNGDDLVDVETLADYSGDFNLIFRMYADGVLKTAREIYTGNPLRLDSGYRGREFYFEVEGNLEVKRIDIGNSMEELKV